MLALKNRRKRNAKIAVLLVEVVLIFTVIYLMNSNTLKSLMDVRVTFLSKSLVIVVDENTTQETIDALIRENIRIENGTLVSIETFANCYQYGEYPVRVLVQGDGEELEAEFTAIITNQYLEGCQKQWVIDKPSTTQDVWIIDVPAQKEKGHWVTTKEKSHTERQWVVDTPAQPAQREVGHWETHIISEELGHWERRIIHHPAVTHTEPIYKTYYGYEPRLKPEKETIGRETWGPEEFFANETDADDAFTKKYADRYLYCRATGNQKQVEVGSRVVVDEPAYDERVETWVVDVPAVIENVWVVDIPATPEQPEEGHWEYVKVIDTPASKKWVVDTPAVAEQGHWESVTTDEIGHYEYIGC